MKFCKTLPRYLKKEVRFFYSQRLDSMSGSESPHLRLPDGTLDIVVCLRGANYISKDGQRFGAMPEVALTGLYEDRCLFKNVEETWLVGAVLNPGYAHLLVNDELHGHAGTHDAADIFGSRVGLLREQIWETVDEREKHIVLEQFLLSRLRKKAHEAPVLAIENAVRSIHESFGNLPVRNLCEMHFMSERNFRRRFVEFVGIPPKTYAAIVRIKAYCMFRRGEGRSPDCIDKLGFVDEPHLFREFRKIAGTTPGEFLRNAGYVSDQFLLNF